MSVFEKHVYLPAELLRALGEQTGHFWASPELEPIICDAVRAWMKPAPAAPQQRAALSEAGYQWKQVFLPEGTRLRACFGGQSYFAVVEGAQIKYDEQSISPSSFANLRGSGNRNAWKTIWLRLPGSDEWLLADVCRLARKSAIARMFGDDAPATKPGSRTSACLRQEQDRGKPPASRQTCASGMRDGGRVPVAVQPMVPASYPLQTKVRDSNAPAAAQDNDIQRKNDSGPAARRKRRARKHVSAKS